MRKLDYRLTLDSQNILVWEERPSWLIPIPPEYTLALESVAFSIRQCWLKEILDSVKLEGK